MQNPQGKKHSDTKSYVSELPTELIKLFWSWTSHVLEIYLSSQHILFVLKSQNKLILRLFFSIITHWHCCRFAVQQQYVNVTILYNPNCQSACGPLFHFTREKPPNKIQIEDMLFQIVGRSYSPKSGKYWIILGWLWQYEFESNSLQQNDC